MIFWIFYGKRFLSNLLLHFYSLKSDELDFTRHTDLTRAEESCEVKEKQINILSLCLYIINILGQSSLQFIQNLGKVNGIKAHFLFIKDKNFLNKHINGKIFIWNKQINIIEYFVMNISSFSKTCDETPELWAELDAVNALLGVVKVNKKTID